MIKDQRTMTGNRRLASVEEVEAVWVKRARRGFAERDDQIGLVNLTAGPPLGAYVNQGRWVADCPLCGGGIACWNENPRGACLSCGRIYTIAFPANLDLVEALLSERQPRNQNYRPDRETLTQLEAENAVHGEAPDAVLEAFNALVEEKTGVN